MSAILPKSRVRQIEFFESRVTDWSARAEQIGTSSAAVATAAEKTAAARAAYKAQCQAYDRARAATQTFHDALAAMNDAGGDIIKQVKARAATDGDSIYALASLPVPAAHSRAPAPGKPDGFKATLLPNGSLKLSWTCDNPRGTQGTVYQVARCDSPAGDHFVTLAVVGKKSIVDTTLPAGVPSVTYEIRAIRSTTRGERARFTVNFGVAPGANLQSIRARHAA